MTNTKDKILSYVKSHPFPVGCSDSKEIVADYFDSFCLWFFNLGFDEVIDLKDEYGDFDFDDEFADALEDKVGYNLDEIKSMIEELDEFQNEEASREVFTNDVVTLELEDDNWKGFPERTGSEAMMRLVKTLPNGKLYSDLKNNLVFVCVNENKEVCHENPN